MDYYKGKKIWITGASSGIGLSLAKALSTHGAYLILSARNMEKLSDIQKELKYPEMSEIVSLDMVDHDAIVEVSATVLERHKVIDILICNAGISQRSLVRNTDFDVDKKLIDINLLGPIQHTKSLLPSMLKQNYGHIVVISSVAGKIGPPLRSAYAASKHGLHGFYDCLRAEEEDNGINVSLITPGYISTNVSSNALVGDGKKNGFIEENSKTGMQPDVFAKKVLNQVAKKKKEIIIGGKETLGIYIKRFFPSILFKIVKGHKA